jgi:hypothetical protein
MNNKPPENKKDEVKYQIDFYKILNENWRHYDSHLWQIPSVALAINAFLIAQAFSDELMPYVPIRMIVVFISAFFTFVLLVALVKHRLHQRAQDKNKESLLELIQSEVPLKYEVFNFSDPAVLKNVEEDSFFIERWLAPRKAHKWLMSVLSITVILDLVVLGGIALCYW